MDPTVTASKSSNRGYRSYTVTKPHEENKQAWGNSHTSGDQNNRRGSYARKLIPGNNREYRVVRDNRNNLKTDKDDLQESVLQSSEVNQLVKSSVSEKSLIKDHVSQKDSAATSDGHVKCQDLNRQDFSVASHRIHIKPISTDDPSPPKDVSSAEVNYTTLASTNSPTGVYSSSSDPVHVPLAGTAGAVRREVGVVGVRRRSTDHKVENVSVARNPFATTPPGKGDSLSVPTLGQHAATSKSNHTNFTLENSTPSMSMSKSLAAGHVNVKPHQQVSHQKAKNSIVEWKPKPNQKSNADINCSTAITSVASSSVDNPIHSTQMQMADLSGKVSRIDIPKNEQVIIPHYLQVPESERTRLTFGSFGPGVNSTMGFAPAGQEYGIIEGSKLDISSSSQVSAGLSKDLSAGQSDLVKSLARSSTSGSSVSAAELDHPQPVNSESVSPRDIDIYPEIELVQSHNPSYSSLKTQQLQNPTNLPSFSSYEPQMKFASPFSGALMDYAHGQSLSSASEALSTHIAGCTPISNIQQQPQQQPVTQFYPQVQIPHYPNFVPYQQMFVPQIAVPTNFANNPSYRHPSNGVGNNYILMPAGNSHITTNNMKFAASQYKPIPSGGPAAGFINYATQGAYNVGSPRTMGNPSVFEDLGRIKDNNLYVQNPQAEADIWIQTPTDLAVMQSTPYYTLPGQAPTAHPAFLQTVNNGQQSFNGAAQSHMQYAGLYQAGPTVAAAPAQMGGYQQGQMGHFGWTNNF